MANTQSGFNPEFLAESHGLNYSDCYPAQPDDKDLHRIPQDLRGGEHFPPVFMVKPGQDTSEIPRFCILGQG